MKTHLSSPSDQPRRRALAAWASALAFTALAGFTGCAGLSGPRTYTLTEADLARLIAKRFPTDQRLMEVLELHVDAPVVHLLPESNRLATEFVVQATDRLFGRSFNGSLALESALRYDDGTHEIRLTQVRVKRLQFEGMAPGMQNTVNRLGGLLAEQLLDNLPIYRFKPEDVERALRSGLQPGAVTVTSRGVEITLVGAKP